MISFRRFVNLLAVVLALSLALPAFAGKKKVTAPETHTGKPTIVALNSKDQTLTIRFASNRPKQTYRIDDMTKLTVINNEGKFTDIKVGMQLDSYIERDGQTLDSLTVSPPDPAAK